MIHNILVPLAGIVIVGIVIYYLLRERQGGEEDESAGTARFSETSQSGDSQLGESQFNTQSGEQHEEQQGESEGARPYQPGGFEDSDESRGT